jgi:hypothetical protein
LPIISRVDKRSMANFKVSSESGIGRLVKQKAKC